MQCPSRAIPWYSSFSTSQGRRTFRSIPSSCRIDLKAGDAIFTVAVHEAHSPLVNVSHCAGFSDAGMTDHPRAEGAGVRKAPRHEVAGSWALASSEGCGELMSAPRLIVGGRAARR